MSLTPFCPFFLIWVFLAVPAKLCKAPAHYKSLIMCSPICNTSCPPCLRVLSYCLLSFNFIPGTHLSCDTQMKKKKIKLLGKIKSLMRCAAYAIFPVIVFILCKFSYTFTEISSTVAYRGWSTGSLAWWQVETTPLTCPKWTNTLRLNSFKWASQNGGNRNAKNGTLQTKNFLDRVRVQKYRNRSTYILLSSSEKPVSFWGNSAGPASGWCPGLFLLVSHPPCLVQWPPTAFHVKQDVINTQKEESAITISKSTWEGRSRGQSLYHLQYCFCPSLRLKNLDKANSFRGNATPQIIQAATP